MKILALPEVQQYLNELINILYNKGYFGFEETALKYVSELETEIRETLPYRHKRKAPKYFERYGKDMFFATFKKSKRTQWYVFFSKYEENKETIYLIRHIENNHTAAQYLI